MKKFLFIFLSIFLASKAYTLEFKFMGGATLSKYTGWPGPCLIEIYIEGCNFLCQKNYKPGFLVGGGFEFSFSKKMAFEIDWLYFQKGCKTKPCCPAAKGITVPIDDTLNVLSIPALLKIKFQPNSSPYVLSGGEFSIILSHKMNGEDITEHTQNFDYGLVLGGGFDIKLREFTFFIEGRYHLGLRNIMPSVRETKAIVLLLGFKV